MVYLGSGERAGLRSPTFAVSLWLQCVERAQPTGTPPHAPNMPEALAKVPLSSQMSLSDCQCGHWYPAGSRLISSHHRAYTVALFRSLSVL